MGPQISIFKNVTHKKKHFKGVGPQTQKIMCDDWEKKHKGPQTQKIMCDDWEKRNIKAHRHEKINVSKLRNETDLNGFLFLFSQSSHMIFCVCGPLCFFFDFSFSRFFMSVGRPPSKILRLNYIQMKYFDNCKSNDRFFILKSQIFMEIM